MAEINDKDSVWVVNVRTGVRQPIAYYKTKSAPYMRRNDLKLDDERLSGAAVKVEPPTIEDKVCELKKEFDAIKGNVVEPIDTETVTQDSNTFEHDGMEVEYFDIEALNTKQLKELADKEGVEYAKNASKATMLELIKNK